MGLLTTGLSRLLELLSNLTVHLNRKPLLYHKLIVALLDLELDPAGELVLVDGSADIPDVLSWQLENLFAIWQVLAHASLLVGPLSDVLDCQALIVWDLNMANLGSLDTELPASYQVFEMVDCDQIYKLKESNKKGSQKHDLASANFTGGRKNSGNHKMTGFRKHI